MQIGGGNQSYPKKHRANMDLLAGALLSLKPTLKSLALISQFSNQCSISEKMTPKCAWHSLWHHVNCLVLYEYDEKSVIWDCVLTNKSAEWEVSDFDFFFHEARVLPSAVGRTCTAEIVLLVTVPAYKWKPSACKVCFSLNIVTLGETVGKTVHMESASGYFRQRRPTRQGTLNRNDLYIAWWYKVF